MMVETTTPTAGPIAAPNSAEAPTEIVLEGEAPKKKEGTSEKFKPEAAPTKPRKTWAMPKAPPQGSEAMAPKKKGLLEIMAEEAEEKDKEEMAQQKQLQQRMLQEEEAALMQAIQASMATNEPSTADMDEDMKLAMMLSMQDQPSQGDAKLPATSTTASTGASPPAAVSPVAATAVAPVAAAAAVAPAAAASATPDSEENGLTEEEMKEIEEALRAADAAENAKTDAASLKLALELQNEEDGKVRAKKKQQQRGPQGNVRTMSRADFMREKGESSYEDEGYYYDDEAEDGADQDQYDDLDGGQEPGFRLNSTKQSPWSRADGATIRGPNQELRTKHDTKLQAQANAYRLEFDKKTGERAQVGNTAYNAFHRSMQKKTVKGVAAHGHGRATADADKTREGALDGRVRLQIARAVNNGLIEAFNGVVKEGKEALVFHAEQGTNSEGFDVAVKVFKRISEFRNRGDYVVGDPRYGGGENFKHAGARQQVELWTEKEHRNLIRAWRAKVPVPKPLWQKENVLFLRFLGEEGWPSPQLREVDIKKGSKKWTALYEQTMTAMQLLYCDAKLVHGDLSEYNILVCPERFLERFDDEAESPESEDEDVKLPATAAANESTGDSKPVAAAAAESEAAKPPAAASDENVEEKLPSQPAAAESTGDSLQIVLIDFGQAVDLRHPDADELLLRDVTRVKEFFDKKGITTVGAEAAMAYVRTKGAPLR